MMNKRMNNESAPSIFDELNEQPAFEYATVGQRFVNAMADAVAIYLVMIVIGYMMAGIIIGFNRHTHMGWLYDVLFLFPLNTPTLIMSNMLYYYCAEAITKGKSLGKYITRTRALDENSFEPITIRHALTRTLCRMIPFEPFSALSGRPWHDIYSRTVVVKDRERIE